MRTYLIDYWNITKKVIKIERGDGRAGYNYV